ncbi:hypothetical protein D9M71_783360 [compost metagenome]
MRAFNAFHECTRLDFVTHLQLPVRLNDADLLPARFRLDRPTLGNDVNVHDVVEGCRSVIDGPGTENHVLAVSVGGQGAAMFILARPIAALSPRQRRHTTTINGAKGCGFE